MLCLWRRSIRLVWWKAAPGEYTPPLSTSETRDRDRKSLNTQKKTCISVQTRKEFYSSVAFAATADRNGGVKE